MLCPSQSSWRNRKRIIAPLCASSNSLLYEWNEGATAPLLPLVALAALFQLADAGVAVVAEVAAAAAAAAAAAEEEVESGSPSEVFPLLLFEGTKANDTCEGMLPSFGKVLLRVRTAGELSVLVPSAIEAEGEEEEEEEEADE